MGLPEQEIPWGHQVNSNKRPGDIPKAVMPIINIKKKGHYIATRLSENMESADCL